MGQAFYVKNKQFLYDSVCTQTESGDHTCVAEEKPHKKKKYKQKKKGIS